MEFHSRDLLISCHEEILVKPLLLVQSEYPAVQLGSYPNTSLTYVCHMLAYTVEPPIKGTPKLRTLMTELFVTTWEVSLYREYSRVYFSILLSGGPIGSVGN